MAVRINRYPLIGNVTALAGPGVWISALPHGTSAVTPNQRMQIASIDVGGKGSNDTDDAASFPVPSNRLSACAC